MNQGYEIGRALAKNWKTGLFYFALVILLLGAFVYRPAPELPLPQVAKAIATPQPPPTLAETCSATLPARMVTATEAMQKKDAQAAFDVLHPCRDNMPEKDVKELYVKALTAALKTASEKAEQAKPSAWQYDQQNDAMTSKASRTASIKSSNSLDLDFPYKGLNFGHLQIRQHPKWGLDVIFSIDKGQLQCNSYGGCPIEVRFDDAPAVRFSGTEPADNSSDTVFIQGAPKFIALAKKSKRILIRMNVYHGGAPVLEFSSPKTLEWDKPKVTQPNKAMLANIP